MKDPKTLVMSNFTMNLESLHVINPSFQFSQFCWQASCLLSSCWQLRVSVVELCPFNQMLLQEDETYFLDCACVNTTISGKTEFDATQGYCERNFCTNSAIYLALLGLWAIIGNSNDISNTLFKVRGGWWRSDMMHKVSAVYDSNLNQYLYISVEKIEVKEPISSDIWNALST